MDVGAEVPQQPIPEQKDQQVLFEIIEKVLAQKKQQVLTDFKKKHKQFIAWLQANNYQLATIKNNLVRYLLATGFSTSMLIATALPSAPPNGSAAMTTSTMQAARPQANSTTPVNYFEIVKTKLLEYKKWPSEQQEEAIATDVSTITKVPAKAKLDGHKMNKLIGFFGAEQHLYRYPGDTLEQHDKAFQRSGIAPGLGAWGYFAPSKTQFTKEHEAREKYYIAAQTFLFPGFYSDRGFKDWLKFRKVLVYNPQNGRAVVAVIGDAGPATWTGKSFGGSPEVMHHLQMVDGRGKSEAVVLFVDDPNNAVPLGPVDTMPPGAL